MNSVISLEQHHAHIHKKIGTIEFVCLMAALMASNSFALDSMLAAFPFITYDFNLSDPNSIQYIISSYLLGYGIFQLFFGPLSDRFGRRPIILIGMCIYTICCILCLISNNFYFLLLMRFFQGAGGATTRVLVVSIIRDVYNGSKMARIMSFSTIMFMIVPIIAPSIGQLILFLFLKWQYIFAFMALIGLAIGLWTYYRLPETLYNSKSLSISSFISAFKTILNDRQAICYAFSFAFILGSLYGSINSAEQIYIDIYHLGKWFAVAFGFIGVFMSVASFNNTAVLKYYSIRKVSHIQLICFLLFSLLWFILSLCYEHVPFVVYMTVYSIIMFAFGGIGANFNTISMNNLGTIAGTAAAIFGFLQTVLGSIIGIVVGQCFNGTTIPISFSYVLLATIALGFVLYAEKGRLCLTKAKC